MSTARPKVCRREGQWSDLFAGEGVALPREVHSDVNLTYRGSSLWWGSFDGVITASRLYAHNGFTFTQAGGRS